MSNRFAEAFIEKLSLLERRAGADVHYHIMPPFTVPLHDLISIQRAAKDIAHFIGLTEVTFIIAVARLEEKVAAHIDLSTSGPEVFIEIDSDTIEFPDAVTSTLCHEICHKWLQVRGIKLPLTIENEILTDITTVYLGLGKIMLNGCNTTINKIERVNNGTRKTTRILKSGYLDRDQFAFIYQLVCAMRDIKKSDSKRGLNRASLDAIHFCDMEFGYLYATQFHNPETTENSVAHFDSIITDHQRVLADLEKHTAYTQQALLETIKNFIITSHKDLLSLRKKASAMTQTVEVNPSIRFLRSTHNQQKLNRMERSLSSMLKHTNDFLQRMQSLNQLVHQQSEVFSTPPPKTFSIVKCPQDGTKLRLPENAGDLIVTCPTCKYSFAYNTTVPDISEPGTRRKTLFERFFRKRKRSTRTP